MRCGELLPPCQLSVQLPWSKSVARFYIGPQRGSWREANRISHPGQAVYLVRDPTLHLDAGRLLPMWVGVSVPLGWQ